MKVVSRRSEGNSKWKQIFDLLAWDSDSSTDPAIGKLYRRGLCSKNTTFRGKQVKDLLLLPFGASRSVECVALERAETLQLLVKGCDRSSDFRMHLAKGGDLIVGPNKEGSR